MSLSGRTSVLILEVGLQSQTARDVNPERLKLSQRHGKPFDPRSLAAEPDRERHQLGNAQALSVA